MKIIFKRIYWRQYPDRSSYWLLSLVLLFFYSTTSLADPTIFSCSQVTDIPQSECGALVTFYQQIYGKHWQNYSGWFSEMTAGN